MNDTFVQLTEEIVSAMLRVAEDNVTQAHNQLQETKLMAENLRQQAERISSFALVLDAHKKFNGGQQ